MTLHFTLQKMTRQSAPATLLAAAEPFERTFGTTFERFVVFPAHQLQELHQPDSDPNSVPENVTIGSRTDERIVADIDVLYRVANSSDVTRQQREEYLDALKRIYSRLPSNPGELCKRADTLCVGIEREGRLLAQEMGWLPPEHSAQPNLKRIPYEGGLVVGLVNLPPAKQYAHCSIVDGAIASGATIISLIEHLRETIPSFSIFSAHSSTEGVRAIARYFHSNGVDVTITVGHVTTGINKKFYAIDPRDTTKLVVGDLGDTISELEE